MFPGAGQGAYTGATGQDLQEAQANQDFWNGVYSQFNPQETAITSAPSTAAYQNIANNAKSMFGNQNSGNMDQNAVGQNLQTKGTQASKTQDINNFLKDSQQNQQTADQKAMSMFSGTNNQNAQNQDLFVKAPEQAMLGQAKTQTQEGNDWNDYYNNQPNFGNELASGIGGGAGKIAGAKVSRSLFGPNVPTDNTTTD